jgi:hypothetical protein
MLFNDDLPLQFEGGMRAQCFVVAETNDASLASEFRAACHQMGLPDPQLEIVGDEYDGLLQLRVVQFAAGLPLFAQIDRLMEMIEVHQKVLIDETELSTASATAAGHLRDMPDSKNLPGLIPRRIERAFRQERALIEDPGGALSIDEALADYNFNDSSEDNGGTDSNHIDGADHPDDDVDDNADNNSADIDDPPAVERDTELEDLVEDASEDAPSTEPEVPQSESIAS